MLKPKKKYFKYPPTQISYLEDVLKEVIRKHKVNYDFKQALDGVKWMFEYIANETKNPEVFTIHLEPLGHLYKNQKFLVNSKQTMSSESEEYAKIMDQIQQLKRHSDECVGVSPHNKTPFSWTFEKFIKSKYEIDDTCRKMYKQNYNIYAAVEEIQNKDYKRITENK